MQHSLYRHEEVDVLFIQGEDATWYEFVGGWIASDAQNTMLVLSLNASSSCPCDSWWPELQDGGAIKIRE
jgi:hypothetical protein